MYIKQLTEHGSYFGYNVNAAYCQLIVKEAPKFKALRLTEVTAIGNVVCCRVLGLFIGYEKFFQTFKGKRCCEVGPVTKTSIQNACTCLTRGAEQKLVVVSRTTPNSEMIFADAEAKIPTHVQSSFIDCPISQSARRLFSLPTRETGINIMEPIDYQTEYAAMQNVCATLEYEDRANAHLT